MKVKSPIEIKASGGLQECTAESVMKADANFAVRTLGALLNNFRNGELRWQTIRS